MTSLEHLDLQDNNLTGEVPSEICNLPNLQVLYLWNNKLCPPYPSCILDFFIGSFGGPYGVGGQDTSECEYCIANPTDPQCDPSP